MEYATHPSFTLLYIVLFFCSTKLGMIIAARRSTALKKRKSTVVYRSEINNNEQNSVVQKCVNCDFDAMNAIMHATE